VTGLRPVLGVHLWLTTSAEGGRSRGLGPFGNATLEYRPNWGFRGLDHPHEQAGAPVLCWETDLVEPGDWVRVVIVPMYPAPWHDIHDGDDLVMYEGARVCGRATVIWRADDVRWPLEQPDVQRFRYWAETGRTT
jgi:hypothetical protein